MGGYLQAAVSVLPGIGTIANKGPRNTPELLRFRAASSVIFL
jgi:hypothetical protein